MIGLAFLENDVKVAKTSLRMFLEPKGAYDFFSFRDMLANFAKDTGKEDIKAEIKQNIKDIKTDIKSDLSVLLGINPQITKTLDLKELKQFINDAKYFLKQKIKAHPDFIKSDLKQLPKNLKSLVKIAKKLNIDIKDIKVENISDRFSKKIKHDTKVFVKTTKTTKIATSDILKVKTTKTIQTKGSSSKIEKKTVTLETVLKTKSLKSKKEDSKIHNNTKTDTVNTDKIALHTHNKAQKNEDLFGAKHISKNVVKVEKAKQSRVVFNEKDNTDETTLKNNHKETLKHLLSSDTNEIKNKISTDFMDIKIHEAKQMMKYLSQDVKKAIDEYKPPFTRLQVKLNPQKLGEIDMTVVQRGNNLHVNLSSNNTAINILTNNLNELKTQLMQNGINNASFNFNSDSNQNQNKQKQKDAQKIYESLDEDESQVNNFEIVIPRYV